MPTGVTVSRQGRIFVSFPRWGDTVEYTVAEITNGQTVPFPNGDINRFDANQVKDHLVSVQSVVVDADDRLWMLDTGSILLGPPAPGAPKMVAVDLKTNKVVKTIAFPPEVATPMTYVNDVRFDLRKGKGGVAYITDSGSRGPNGIVVVDLDSGRSWRKLNGHRAVRAEKDFQPRIQFDPKIKNPLMNRPAPGLATPIGMGSDGIALSADGTRLFFCPLAGRHLYSVGTDALIDEAMSDADVQKTLIDHGERNYASDGLECDANGRVYLTDYEHNAIHVRPTDSKGFVTNTSSGDLARGVGHGQVIDQIIAQGPDLWWPDTMSIGPDGFLYFTANQLQRQKDYNEGKDLREKPYRLMRVKIDAQPVMLK